MARHIENRVATGADHLGAGDADKPGLGASGKEGVDEGGSVLVGTLLGCTDKDQWFSYFVLAGQGWSAGLIRQIDDRIRGSASDPVTRPAPEFVGTLSEAVVAVNASPGIAGCTEGVRLARISGVWVPWVPPDCGFRSFGEWIRFGLLYCSNLVR